jgi:hypothetical protein
VKKYLAIIVGMLLVLGLAASAYAVHDTPAADEAPVMSVGGSDISLSGKIISKGWYLDNINPYSAEGFFDEIDPWMPSSTDSTAFYHTTFQLMVDAKINDNIQGVAELETGVSDKSGLYYWGSYDNKPNDGEIWFKQLWIQYTGSGLLGIPSGIKIGHMPISLGEKIFLDNERFGDDGIIAWIDPMKELHISAATLKLEEGELYNHTDDLDAYLLLSTYQLDKDNLIGLHFTYLHSDGNLPVLPPGDSDSGSNVSDLNIYNIGVHGNGNVGGLDWAAEVDFHFGSVDDVPVDDFTNKDIDAKGWGLMTKLGYMIDPVNIRGMFGYGSGDDDPFDGDNEQFQTLLGPDYGFTARKTHYTFVYERIVRTAALPEITTNQEGGDITNTGLANTTVYNLGLDLQALENLSLSLDGFLLYASETDGWEELVEQSVDDEIGWEIDFRLNWNIAKNLNYFIEAGMLDAGDFYEDAFGINAKTAYAASHGIALSF